MPTVASASLRPGLVRRLLSVPSPGSCPVLSSHVMGAPLLPPSQAKGAEPFLQSPPWRDLVPSSALILSRNPTWAYLHLSIPLGRAAHSVETLPRGDRGASGEGAQINCREPHSDAPGVPSQLSSVSYSPRSKCPHSMGSAWCSRLASWAGSGSQDIGGMVGRREPWNPIRPGPNLTSSLWSETAGYLPNIHTRSWGPLPLTKSSVLSPSPKPQRRVPNIQTFWNPGRR